MSSDNHDTTDKFIPVNTDKVPIIFDGNRAKIAGYLNQTNDWLVRNNLMQNFIQHNCRTPRRTTRSRARPAAASRSRATPTEHHDKMKHVARRHFFVRDMVESLELEVPFVRTDDNAADLLTKAIKGVPKFFKFRSIIMNEPTPAY